MENVEVTHNEQKIEKLKQQVNEMEQYNGRRNLEVHRLSKHANENLLAKQNSLAKDLELAQLCETDIEAVRRLLSKAEKTALVFVRFSSRQTETIGSEERVSSGKQNRKYT